MSFVDFFQSKTVVVTGAAGFIGSHLCDRLLTSGATVIGLDNLLTGNLENLTSAREHSQFSFYQVDLCDSQATSTLLSQLIIDHPRLDLVLHFASPASPPSYQKYPVETYLVNTWALHNLLTFLRQHQPTSRLLFAGTSEAYGNPLEHPQSESYWGNVNPNGIRSCYDEAKRLGETICGVFFRDFAFDARIVRIFNTYGPRMDLADGRILPQFIRQYLTHEPLTVYGDGSQTRSYCFVDDLVTGILTFAAAPDLAGETINLGNPREFTILETAQLFNQLTNQSVDNLTFLPLPQDDPLRRQPDISKAKNLLQWQPVVDFIVGLQKMLDFYTQKR